MTFDQLMAHFKTQVAAAEALGIAQSSVSEWQKNGIPFVRQVQFERATRGKLRADPPPAPKPKQEARA